MKKTLIASAIAAATFSGSVLAQESNMPTVYGNIQYAAIWDDVEDGSSSFGHYDNGSTLGVKHSHEIAPGITGFFKIELQGINADDSGESSGLSELDEAYIGIRGDSFGQLWLGSDDSMYETTVETISQTYEVGAQNLFVNYDTGEGDLVQYLSPSFGGLQIGAAVEVNGDGDAANSTGENEYPYQLAVIYSMDMFELAAAMDSNDNGATNNENTYGLRGTVNLDALTVTAEYHTRKDDADTYGLQGTYTMGANRFIASYEVRDFDYGTEDSIDTITLQAMHNLSDNMYVYAEGTLGGGDELYTGARSVDATGGFSDERSLGAIGAVYYF